MHLKPMRIKDELTVGATGDSEQIAQCTVVVGGFDFGSGQSLGMPHVRGFAAPSMAREKNRRPRETADPLRRWRSPAGALQAGDASLALCSAVSQRLLVYLVSGLMPPMHVK